MALKIFGNDSNIANIVIAKSSTSFATMGFNSGNIAVIFEVGTGGLKSWVPGRTVNAITGATAGKGYYIQSLTDIDVSTYFETDGNSGGGGGSDPINLASQVWVEEDGDDDLGSVGTPAKPFATVPAALGALTTGGIVHVGIGTFASPALTDLKSNIWIKGSGKPQFNNTATGATFPNVTVTAPTKLVGGTIFQGAFVIPVEANNFHMTDCGVDVGSDFIGGGANQEGLIAGGDNDGSHPSQVGKLMRKNIVFKNISVLQKDGSTLVHCFVAENCFQPIFENIDTWGGFAGFVSKNVGAICRNIRARHSSGTYYNIIIKQNGYAYALKTLLDGFIIEDGGGLAIHNENGAGTGGMQKIIVSNGFIDGTAFGVKQLDNAISLLLMSNVMVTNCTGKGFEFFDLRKSQIVNCSCIGVAGIGFDIVGKQSRISNCHGSDGGAIDFEIEGGASDLEPMLVNGCTGMSAGFNYIGDFVYGVGNYGVGKTGDITEPAEDLATLGGGSDTLAGYIDETFTANDGTFVLTARAYTSSGSVGFSHYGIGDHLLASATDGSFAIKHVSTVANGAIGMTNNTVGYTSYAGMKVGFEVHPGGSTVFDNGIPTVGPSTTVGNWYKIQRTGSVWTMEESADDGASWSVIYTFAYTGTPLMATVADLYGSGAIPYPMVDF